MDTILIQKFDEMVKDIIPNKHQIKLLEKFRSELISSEKHTELLAQHFEKVLNSGEISDKYAREIGLL